MFDENGNVIGIAVKGTTRMDVVTGINLFIPIADGIKVLVISIAAKD